ncbi:MAG: hypothetical protein Q9P44_19885 [Anaerolineae bacterium]|nr:hypothetical protein [Anaerolineae bacterium]
MKRQNSIWAYCHMPLQKNSLMILALFLFFITITPVSAQDTFIEYRWQEADLALRYPADWDDPLALFNSETSANVLQMAQEFVTSPTRPPAIPVMTLMLIPDVTPETDLYGLMETELQNIDIRPIGPIPATLLETDAIATNGTDRNRILFGLGRIALLNTGDTQSALLIMGRAAIAQRDSFTALFNNVANSFVQGANRLTTAPEYGVLWYRQSLPTDGANAFLDVRSLTIAPDGRLYLLDGFVGIVIFDASTGAIDTIIPVDNVIATTAIEVDSEGNIYVGDVACGCIRLFADGEETAQIGRFNLDSPRSIALADDGTLYATDVNENGVLVHELGANSEASFIFEVPLIAQPLLTIDQLGRLIVLVDNVTVYGLEGAGFSPLYDLQVGTIAATEITINDENHLVVATEQQGVLIFDDDGNEINRVGRIVAGFPSAGELVRPQGVAAAVGGTIFWADSDGGFGNVTAASLGVEAGRVGGTKLTAGIAVEGTLNDDTSQQTWAFDALAGERITLTAVASLESLTLDIALRLLAPDGSELIFVDNDEEGLTLNPFNPQIRSLDLPQDGEYVVIVELVSGTGRYQMGLSKSRNLELETGELAVQGMLSEVLPLQEWILDGRGGQSITVTLESVSGTLDPIVRVLNPRGDVLAENDDALDAGLGLNSQVIDVSLPQNGAYIIQAARFFGDGAYVLTIEQN